MRVWKEQTGRLRYKARGTDASGQKVQRSFATASQRDDFVREFEDRKARARAGLPVQQRNIPLNELVELYLANNPEKTSSEWFERMLKRPLDEFGTTLIRDLRPEVFGRWLHALPLSAKTKTHILTCARQVTRAGLDWGYIERDPLRPGAVKGPGTKRKRPIRPFESWDEVEAVATALGNHRQANFVRFVCLTGAMVPSEALAITSQHYDKATGELHIPGTKTENRDRTIPVSKPARELIESLPVPIKKDLPYFRFNYQRWRKHWWTKALDEAGLARRTPNEMRHTFATLALQEGLPIETVSELMGHADITVTLTYYAKFTKRKLAQDVALMDNITSKDGHAADTQAEESQ